MNWYLRKKWWENWWTQQVVLNHLDVLMKTNLSIWMAVRPNDHMKSCLHCHHEVSPLPEFDIYCIHKKHKISKCTLWSLDVTQSLGNKRMDLNVKRQSFSHGWAHLSLKHTFRSTGTSRSHAFIWQQKQQHSLIMAWLNANYDRNASTREPVLAQLYHMSELTTHTHFQTHTHIPT